MVPFKSMILYSGYKMCQKRENEWKKRQQLLKKYLLIRYF